MPGLASGKPAIDRLQREAAVVFNGMETITSPTAEWKEEPRMRGKNAVSAEPAVMRNIIINHDQYVVIYSKENRIMTAEVVRLGRTQVMTPGLTIAFSSSCCMEAISGHT